MHHHFEDVLGGRAGGSAVAVGWEGGEGLVGHGFLGVDHLGFLLHLLGGGLGTLGPLRRRSRNEKKERFTFSNFFTMGLNRCPGYSHNNAQGNYSPTTPDTIPKSTIMVTKPPKLKK